MGLRTGTTTGTALFALAWMATGCAERAGDQVSSLGSEGHIEADGAQLLYAAQGEGPPMVLLHGGPGIGQGYFMVGLAIESFPPEGFRWVAYDQRGSGRSTGSEDPSRLTIEQFVEDLETVRRATGAERMGLMGHSFGGLLALHYAIRYPERLFGMILLDPDPASRDLWERHREIVASRRTEREASAMDSISAQEGWELDPRELESYHLLDFRPYFGRQEAWSRLMLGLRYHVFGNFPGTALAVRESLGEWDVFDELQTVEVPTLIITGDRSIFPLSAHDRLREALPNAELVVLPGVGHFPHMEDPEAFSDAAGAFLTRLRGGGEGRR